MPDFNEISSRYEKDSVVQGSASEILFDMLHIQPNDDVLDLGCGTGHIAKFIQEKTKGKVVAVDPSEGMIKKAQEKFSSQDILFRVCSAEQLDYQDEFDIIFCNSAFQWFVNPQQALKSCLRSLRMHGKMAIQAPAKDHYCPNFLRAIDEVKNDKDTQGIFSCFKAPWFFRNTAKEYAALFESVGFKVAKSTIDKVVTSHAIEEAYKIFESGAAAGYLNQDYYSTPLSQKYIERFRNIVRRSLEDQADKTGQVRLTFYRIYLLAIKNI
jgi:ubiquinone/menaquinone biosynthesis C-methylase UbiE